MTQQHTLTPAGLQVEEALAAGYDNAAFNIYTLNIRDDVAMVEGEAPGKVSIWPEWHRMIQAKIGMDDEPVLGEATANEEADELGLTGEEREDYIAQRVDEISESEPSIIEQAVRGDDGRISGTELIENPRLGH